jgi:hypothetical protein
LFLITAGVISFDILDMLFYYPLYEKPTLDICMESNISIFLFYS